MGSPIWVMPRARRPPATWADQQHDAGRPVDPDEDSYMFTVETFNATSWPTLHRRLMCSEASVLLAQEIGTTACQHASHSRAALKLGWQSIFACSNPGEAGQTTAGVAIFARPEVCIRADPHCPAPCGGRLVSALVRPPGWPEGRLISAYLYSGRGIKGHASLIADVGQLHSLPGHMPITGADWAHPAVSSTPTSYPMNSAACGVWA